MPYLASMPMSPSPLLFTAGDTTRSVVDRAMPYGLSSMLRLAGGSSSPTSVAAAEMRKNPCDPPITVGSGVRWTHSFLRRIARRIWMPQVCPSPDR